MRAFVAGVVAAGVMTAGCTNETGLPDLDAVGPDDFPVGETVVIKAEVDGAFAESDDHRYVTGEMRAGEETHWIMSAPAEIDFECGGERGTDEGTIEVTAQPGP